MLPAILLATLVLAAAAYAQREIPRFTASPRAALLVRAGLIVLGIVFGYVASDNFSAADARFPLLAFLIGFGAVHVPAALILLIKRAGGAAKS